MQKALSPIDAISPAFEHARRQLFQPFRFGHWARMAVIALLTGEFAGGGWSSGNVNLPAGQGQGQGDEFWLSQLAQDPWQTIREYLPVIAVLLVAVLAVGLIFSYIESVFRFLMLDAVLRGRAEIRAGWSRWSEKGGGYFLWQLGLSLVLLAAAAIVIGLPVLYAWHAGWFAGSDQNFGKLLLGGLVLFVLFIALALFGALAVVFTRDFVIPLVALENVTITDGWRRLLPMLRREKGAFFVYLLMKIVLGLGSAIVFGIVDVMALLVLLIPLAILGVIVFIAAQAASLTWNLGTIAVALLAGVGVLAGLFFLMGFIYVPGLVFFQAYPLYFFAGRFPALAAVLSPPPPETSPPLPEAAAPAS